MKFWNSGVVWNVASCDAGQPSLSSAAKIEQETSETGETGGIETGHNSETTKMLPITIFLK